MPRLPPNRSIPRLWRHHSRRPRKRSCDSMMCSSNCARSNPARPLLGLLVWSFSIRRSAASTRSRARSNSATVYCRDCGGVRFPRGPFDALFAGMADLGCFMAERIAYLTLREWSLAPSTGKHQGQPGRRAVPLASPPMRPIAAPQQGFTDGQLCRLWPFPRLQNHTTTRTSRPLPPSPASLRPTTNMSTKRSFKSGLDGRRLPIRGNSVATGQDNVAAIDSHQIAVRLASHSYPDHT
jgi:hypothetical protein